MHRSVRVSAAAACATLVCASAAAQSVKFAVVAKTRRYEQTSAADVLILPAYARPFGFGVSVTGDDIGLLSPAPTISGPFAVGEPFHNGGVLGYDPDDEEWRYGAPAFQDFTAETQPMVDAAFGSGMYTLAFNGVGVDLDLSGDAYPAAPVLTLGGGAWESGVYVLPHGHDLTVTTSAFAEYGTHPLDAIWLWAWNADYTDEIGVEQFSASWDCGPPLTASNTATMTVPAGWFQPGEPYAVESGFAAVVDFMPDHPGFPCALFGAVYEVCTELTVLVQAPVDCPADLAEPIGLLDLADILAFIAAFTSLDPAADFDGNGLSDLADINLFVTAFTAGCP